MNRREYMLNGDLGNWSFYAVNVLNMDRKEAELEWYNHNHKGKYIICDAREDDSTRLFIRTVTNIMEDGRTKKGWWDTFTVTKNPVKKGLYVCEIISYRYDRHGYLNLEASIVSPIDEMKFRELFAFNSDGTWNSVAFYLMITMSRAFLDKYDFPNPKISNPNYSALIDNFSYLDSNMSVREIGKIMLDKYLTEKVTIKEIEDCLNKLTLWEEFVIEIQKDVAYHRLEDKYGERYPLFASKIRDNVTYDIYIYRDRVEHYLNRQLDYYKELVKDNKIEEVEREDDWLEKIERGLQYRKSLKDAEKAERKRKRLAKKQK